MHDDELYPKARLRELAAIFALGILILHRRMQRSGSTTETSPEMSDTCLADSDETALTVQRG